MSYIVRNIYGIEGTSVHHKVVNALMAADKREGDGWIVDDKDGCQWVWDNNKNPYKITH